MSWNRPDKNRKADPLEATKEEVKHIDSLSGQRPLRLHVVGDCKTKEAAEILSEAATRYISKHNMPVFTFTHNWREIPREAWGDISVLASVETEKEGIEAQNKGYAVAIVRPTKPVEKRAKKLFSKTGKKHASELPCLNETLGIDCIKCGMCMSDGRLFKKKLWIRFYTHGSQRKKAAFAIKEKQCKTTTN